MGCMTSCFPILESIEEKYSCKAGDIKNRIVACDFL